MEGTRYILGLSKVQSSTSPNERATASSRGWITNLSCEARKKAKQSATGSARGNLLLCCTFGCLWCWMVERSTSMDFVI